MNQRYFSFLAVALVVVAGAYFFARSSEETSFRQEPVQLFAGVSIEDVVSMKVQKGGDTIEIGKKDGNWGIPARDYYTADAGKVRALVLKMLELSSTQKITSDVTKYEKLGVGDDVQKSGQAKVVLLGSDSRELATLYVGEMRQNNSRGSFPSVAGQYVRKGGSPDVYLVSESIPVDVSMSSWLDARIANVLQSSVRNITQYSLTGDTEEKLFRLNRNTKSEEKGASRFLLEGNSNPDDVDALTLSQVVAGLENLRFIDVIKPDDAELAEVSFDYKTVYRLENGLEYSVITGKKETIYYAKFHVSFVPSLVDEVKAEREQLRKQLEESGEDQKGRVVKDPKYANELDAKELNKQYGDWVFKVAEYVGQKFRREGEHIRKKAPAAEKPA